VYIRKPKIGMVTHACKPIKQEAEARGPRESFRRAWATQQEKKGGIRAKCGEGERIRTESTGRRRKRRRQRSHLYWPLEAPTIKLQGEDENGLGTQNEGPVCRGPAGRWWCPRGETD
jgi:hypothetical protein